MAKNRPEFETVNK